MTMNVKLLTEATAFIWTEADMLDHGEYQAWLKLWDESGRYIIPIDPDLTDYANHLNYAYDDQRMRQLRVQRLENCEAISTSPKSMTVRSLSRIRIIEQQHQENKEIIVLRCAQDLREFHQNNLRHYMADVTYFLEYDPEFNFKINKKIINLINSKDALSGISYIL